MHIYIMLYANPWMDEREELTQFAPNINISEGFPYL